MKFASNKNQEMHGSDNDHGDQVYKLPEEEARNFINLKSSMKTSLTTSNLPYVTRTYLTANMVDMNNVINQDSNNQQ